MRHQGIGIFCLLSLQLMKDSRSSVRTSSFSLTLRLSRKAETEYHKHKMREKKGCCQLIYVAVDKVTIDLKC